MSHQYTLQLHTGSFLKANYSAAQIMEKCDAIFARIKVKDLILGWNTDPELNRTLLDYFHTKGVRVLLWLPILAKSDEVCEITYATTLSDQDKNAHFACPNHIPNSHAIITLYEQYFANLPFDGVFLDKIRFASFAEGYEQGFGCFCAQCEKQMHSVDLPYIKKLIQAHDNKLMRGEYDRYGRYHFADFQVNTFYKRRSQYITDLVFKLAAYFNSRKLVVGADLFAPILAYHVGQNIKEIGKLVDFVKPMMYTHTEAPSGIPYEYHAYITHFAQSEAFTKHFPGGPLSRESLRVQMEYIANVPAHVVPGIEINPIQGICHTNAETVKDHLSLFAHYSTIALCWDIMQIQDAILAVL
ncbi:MAG: hypothetical protein HFE68_05320 [Erysipelotrichaceae bacterium]|nr:hypothetical protein [Erysipelotrichaceae bacterium]MCI9312768.1 hypothetical protein [Erysipelotrichaceae bacterium]